MKGLLLALFVMSTGVASQINGQNSVGAQVNWQNNPVGAFFAREGGETPVGTFRCVSDGIEVYTLITADKEEFYQPASLFYGVNDADKGKVDALAPSGKVASSMNCFLVKAQGKNILIDTGLPPSRDGQTLNRLKELNITPSDIDVIYLTHSHFDHIGALIGDAGECNFPMATVYVSSREWEYMQNNMQDFVAPFKKAYEGRIVAINPGELLPCGFMAIDAAGHTPGHVVYRTGNLLFVGDILHGMAVQLIDPSICASFDMDKAQAIKSRIDILNYAVANSLTVMGAHVPNNGVIF